MKRNGRVAGAASRPFAYSPLALGVFTGMAGGGDGWRLGAPVSTGITRAVGCARLTGVATGCGADLTSATGAGWVPGKVRFDDVDVDAFDLFVGMDGVAWQKDELTLIPSAGLR
ncbi:MAG: hypothetical protein ACNA7M_12370, partial [Roseovarius sp.]